MINAALDFRLDRAGLKSRFAKAERTFHRRAGAYVRRVAMNSVKTRKKRSTRAERNARIGKPPVSNSKLFKRSILFDFDTVTAKTVVGPIGGKKNPSPAAFEYGGAFPFKAPRKDAPPEILIGNYRKFPTMGPALKNSAPKFPSFWSLRN